MKAVTVIALLATGAPVVAAYAADNAQFERKRCTRVEQQSGSRLSYRRVCLTAAQWRERLGVDWQQRLAGRQSVDEQMDDVENRSRVHSTMPTSGMGSGASSGTFTPRGPQ